MAIVVCYESCFVLCMQEIYKDRKKFSRAVFEVASSDLVNMGISVVSYTLKDIRDEEVGEQNLHYIPYSRTVVWLEHNIIAYYCRACLWCRVLL
jgi:hypothetical protein